MMYVTNVIYVVVELMWHNLCRFSPNNSFLHHQNTSSGHIYKKKTILSKQLIFAYKCDGMKYILLDSRYHKLN